MKFNLTRPNRLSKEIIFADGIGSSGKGMLSHILSCFDRVEKQSNHTVFDFIPYIFYMNKITHDAAVTYLQTEADMQLYHMMISRDVNFRVKDSTGVFKNGKRFEYIRRLFRKEGDSVVKRIFFERPILNEAPHDALRNSKLFFDAFGNDLKIIYVVRAPFELILDWKRRGFANRIGEDPREFQLNILMNNSVVPMFMMDYQIDYNSLNEYERLLYFIHFCYKTNLNGYLNLSNSSKSNIFITTFDSLCINPKENINAISKFLNLKLNKSIVRILKQENLPRKINTQSEYLYEQKIKQNISNKHHFLLEDLKDLHDVFLKNTRKLF